MNMSATLNEIATLSVDERIQWVEAIWDTIAAEPDRVELTEAQERELDRRLAAHDAHPTQVVPWEEIRRKALERARR